MSEPTTCPTCGAAVRVSVSAEGTGCYLPDTRSVWCVFAERHGLYMLSSVCDNLEAAQPVLDKLRTTCAAEMQEFRILRAGDVKPGGVVMVFESLFDSAKKGELLLVDGGMLRFHLRRDRQITIHEIIVTRPGCGIGTALLNQLRGMGRQRGADCIVAKCPADLPANRWYRSRGFCNQAEETTPTGRRLNVWHLPL